MSGALVDRPLGDAWRGNHAGAGRDAASVVGRLEESPFKIVAVFVRLLVDFLLTQVIGGSRQLRHHASEVNVAKQNATRFLRLLRKSEKREKINNI